MAEYKVYFKESVEKDLSALPKKDFHPFGIIIAPFETNTPLIVNNTSPLRP
jgi:hypothetical protein